MVTLSLICPKCGSRVSRDVDERFFPSSIPCSCGARIPLSVERESPRESYSGLDAGVSSGASDADFDTYVKSVETG